MGDTNIWDNMGTDFQIVSVIQWFPQVTVISESYPLTKTLTSFDKKLNKDPHYSSKKLNKDPHYSYK